MYGTAPAAINIMPHREGDLQESIKMPPQPLACGGTSPVVFKSESKMPPPLGGGESIYETPLLTCSNPLGLVCITCAEL